MKTWKDPQVAFDQAIKAGRLSHNPQSDNFAGKYMYMGPTVGGQHDAFKNIITREYLPVKVKVS